MSEHVLKKGECPICDASEFQSLRTRLAACEAERLGAESSSDIQRARAQAAERTLEAERGVVIACTRRAESAEANVEKLLRCLNDANDQYAMAVRRAESADVVIAGVGKVQRDLTASLSRAETVVAAAVAALECWDRPLLDLSCGEDHIAALRAALAEWRQP